MRYNDFMNLKMPEYYTLCQNERCPKADDCLRKLCYDENLPDTASISVINPNRYPSSNEDCHFFVSKEKIRMSWGVKDFYSALPHDAAKAIKKELLMCFGRTKYYRFFREELPISPSEQESIRQIFKKNGIESEPCYTHFSEEYSWKS